MAFNKNYLFIGCLVLVLILLAGFYVDRQYFSVTNTANVVSPNGSSESDSTDTTYSIDGKVISRNENELTLSVIKPGSEQVQELKVILARDTKVIQLERGSTKRVGVFPNKIVEGSQITVFSSLSPYEHNEVVAETINIVQ
ncbi:MAG TPA: hypothetical protein VD770_00580 [Coxiellaceae bacterium]|nr:hypothetical protein [Coxiellaceae bacterium]